MSRTLSTALSTAAVVMMMSVAPAVAHQPGAVHCHKGSQSTSAHAVCASKRLSALDNRMSQLFKAARYETDTRSDMLALHDDQRSWAAKRDRCNGRRICIWWRTKQRIRQLNGFLRNT